MIAVWAVLVVAGLSVSVVASGSALRTSEALGRRAGLSPIVIGLTIVSIGTDLPEIANSILASAAGRGDLNVGDSTGSAATQITLVLGVLCLLRPLAVGRRFAAIAGAFTVSAFVVAAAMMSDGSLSRLDGLLLVLIWVAATAVTGRSAPLAETRRAESSGPGIALLAGKALLALAVVGAGAALAVTAFGRLTDDLGVPEYATSFLVLSIGTSLPELLVDGRAVLRGMGALALGDILGSSLIDATLSLGIGPLLFPTAVSAEAARGTLLVGAVVAAAVILLVSRRLHDWKSGLTAIGLYLLLFPLVII